MATGKNANTNPISGLSRRWFVKITGKTLALLALLPNVKFLQRPAKAASAGTAAHRPPVVATGDSYTLLKNGLIAYGTRKKGFRGTLIIKN